MNKIKACNRCKTTEDLYFWGRVVLCRKCNAAKQREKYARAASRKAILKTIKKYEENNKIRVDAWHKATILPMHPCEVCGAERVHKHHPDVNKPLDVIFLCPLHHKAAHKELIMV